MRKFLVLGLGLVLVAAACNRTPETSNNTENDNQNSQLESPANDNRTFVVQLSEQNNSKQNGTARLKAEGANQVKVNIEVSPGAKDVQQPAHIHSGSCPTPGAIKWALNNVVNGKSETIIDGTLDEIVANLPLVINVHKSTTESGVYVSCGTVPTDAEGSTTPAPSPSPSASNSSQITINANGFAPATLTIKKGTTVTFKNADNKPHWPASAPHPSHTDYATFDPQQGIAAGTEWNFKFDQVGTWKYHDHLYPTKFGTIVVTE